MKIAICGHRCVTEAVISALLKSGYATEVFLPDGQGGAEMECRIRADEFQAVLDLDLRELVAELFHLQGSAGPDRLTGAAVAGIPQVVCLSGWDSGLSVEQADRLGQDIAQRLCASNSPTALIIPHAKTIEAEVLRESIRQWAYGFEMIDLAEQENPSLTLQALVDVSASTLQRMLAKHSHR